MTYNSKRFFKLTQEHLDSRNVVFESACDPNALQWYVLKSEIKQWLDHYGVIYLYTEDNMAKKYTSRSKQVSICNPVLYIDSDDVAALFKLSWM